MRPLTKNEKVLGTVFAGVLLLMGLLIGVASVRRTVDAARREQSALSARIAELRQWETRRDTLERRAAWLRENSPPVWDEQNSTSRLVEDLQESLGRMNIEINNQRLLETAYHGKFCEAGVQLNLKASTEELVRWLYEIQRPGKFITVRQINLRSDSDKSNLRAELSIVKHFLATGPSATEPDSIPHPKKPLANEVRSGETGANQPQPESEQRSAQTLAPTETSLQAEPNRPMVPVAVP